MSVFAIVLTILIFGIIVGLASKKLSWLEFLMCAIFGLLVGTTDKGLAVSHAVTTTFSTVTGWFG